MARKYLDSKSPPYHQPLLLHITYLKYYTYHLMASPEHNDYYPESDPVYLAGVLSLAPTVSIVEHVQLRGHDQPIPLVTKRSLQRYQQESEHVASRYVASVAWSSLSVCVPGTVQADRYKTLIQPSTPDFTSQSIVGTRWPIKVAGFLPETFPNVIDQALTYQKYIPGLGKTAIRFLEEAAIVLQLNMTADQYLPPSGDKPEA